MSLRIRTFETRVALRVALLFLACAALPVATFATIGYFQVRGQLAEQGWARLQSTGKTVGMSLVERLLLLDAELERITRVARGVGSDFETRVAGSGHFVAAGITSIEDPRGTVPPPNAREAGHLRGGRVLLRVTEEVPPRVLLLRREDADGRIAWGEVSLDYLALTANGLPAEAVLCVTTEGRPLLGCDVEGATGTRPVGAGVDGMASVEWEGRDGTWIGVSRELFLAAEFGAAPWVLTVSERRDRVFAPLASFSRTFWLVCLLCLLVVAYASHEQLHRTLDPLSRLIKGTQRVSAGDLSVRVDLHTGDEFEDLSDSFNGMVSTLARQFRALSTSHEIDGAILGAQDIPAIAETVLRQLPGLVEADRAAITLLDPGRQFELDPDGALAQRIPHLDRDRLDGVLAGGGRGGGGSAYDWHVPIHLAGELQGVVSLGRASHPVEEDELGPVRQIADHVAVAIQNARLLRDLDDLNVGTLRALAGAIDAKSHWTAGHSNRVTRVGLEIGRELGLDAQEMEVLERGSILHDVGKIAIPARILDKEGDLTDEEWDIMRSHPGHGVRIVAPIGQYERMLPIIAQHHERWDGSGYPEGIAGQGIDPLARITAVADVFDALTSDRPYRKGIDTAEVVDMIAASRGTGFDPRVVDAFVRTRTARSALEDSGRRGRSDRARRGRRLRAPEIA